MSTQHIKVDVVALYPDHAPRAKDPAYKYFSRARHHAIDVLNLPCWVAGSHDEADKARVHCNGGRQYHHLWCEFAAQNGVSLSRMAIEHPSLDCSDLEAFKKSIEGDETSYMVLCMQHHVGHLGIHVLPEPIWSLQKIARDDWSFIQ